MKKAFSLILISVMFFIGVGSASARTLTLTEVANKFNELNITGDYAQCHGKITAVVDTGVLSMQCGGNEIFIFIYDSSAKMLSYTNPETPGTIHKNDAAIYDLVDGILESVLIQSGYEKMTLDDNINTDGLLLITDYFAYFPEDVPEYVYYRYGRVLDRFVSIKRLDITLDTAKIANIVKDYGDPYIRKILEEKPTIEAKNVTSSSVDLYPKVANTPVDSSYEASCYLYSSTEENGEYTKTHYDNCLTGVKITNTNLDAGTTYYYKIQMERSRIVSDPISVTTSVSSVEPAPIEEPTPENPVPEEPTPEVTPNPGTDPEKENPNTGAFVSAAVLSLFTVGSIGAIVYTNKKNRFKNLDI